MRPMLSRCAPVMVLVKQCLQCHWHQILSKTRDATSVLLYLSRIKSSLLLATNNFITSLEGFRVFFFLTFRFNASAKSMSLFLQFMVFPSFS